MLIDRSMLAHAGGIFAVLVFIHFFVDWIFQTHNDAMRKSHNSLIRAGHCAVYTIGFAPLLCFMGIGLERIAAALAILFVSHFIEDTYIPVFIWAKYIRKVPKLNEHAPSNLQVMKNGKWEKATDAYWQKEKFGEWVTTPLGAILMITIDQIIHISFLWPVVYLIMH